MTTTAAEQSPIETSEQQPQPQDSPGRLLNTLIRRVQRPRVTEAKNSVKQAMKGRRESTFPVNASSSTLDGYAITKLIWAINKQARTVEPELSREPMYAEFPSEPISLELSLAYDSLRAYNKAVKARVTPQSLQRLLEPAGGMVIDTHIAYLMEGVIAPPQKPDQSNAEDLLRQTIAGLHNPGAADPRIAAAPGPGAPGQEAKLPPPRPLQELFMGVLAVQGIMYDRQTNGRDAVY